MASFSTKMKHAKNKEFVSDVKRLFRAMLGYFSHFVGCSRMTAKNNVIRALADERYGSLHGIDGIYSKLFGKLISISQAHQLENHQ